MYWSKLSGLYAEVRCEFRRTSPMRFAMKALLVVVAVAGLMALPVRATDDVVSALHGTITKLDSATKTAVVKTEDGTEHTIHFVDKTAVHGAEATAEGSKDAFHGLKEGSEVAVHYTEKGSEKTAVEVDHLGKDGIKSVDGTVSKVGEGEKTVTGREADARSRRLMWWAGIRRSRQWPLG